jgi:Domain of unknown function (DUF927)
MPRGQNPSLEIFLRLLYPWEDEHSQLWKSVSWTFTASDGQQGMVNYAAQDYDRLMHLIESRTNWRGANLYTAMGTQRLVNMEKAGTNDGFPRASRRINNMVSYKSIWLDIDVGKAGAYATTGDAYAALDDFCAHVGLPVPTMEVLSGSGGIHVYWCTADPFPLDAWIPLSKGLRDAAIAYGLKFDPQVTVNAAGILRVPGTWNHKTVPAKPVHLVCDEDIGFPQYSYQQLVNALGQHVGPLAGVRMNQASIPNVTGINQNFSAGVSQAPPVSIDEVAAVCPVIDDILLRGGKGDAEPLWNLALMLASFTDDPHDAAHRLSDQDPRYTSAGTDKKLAEKVSARNANQAIGWPLCTSFSPLHPLCQTCPLFAQGKSPLHFAAKAKTYTHAAPPGKDILMPPNYWRDINRVVYTAEADKQGNPQVVKVMGDYPILDAGIDPESGKLVVRTAYGGSERWGDAAISGNQGPLQAAQAFSTGVGIYVMQRYHKTLRDFSVSWMTHLQDTKRFIAPTSYGWTDDGKGFTFDETIYRTDGSKDVVFRGGTLDKRFVAKGELKPWQDAMVLLYGNAALETVVASSFAAPLVELVGSASLVMSIYSHLSGNGKTTSMMLAQAVWGNPRTGMSSLNDTHNSVMKKIADLKNLPIYWDELRTVDQMEKVIDLVFSVTQGKAKSRLTREIHQAEAPSFTTMFAVASNYGIGDTVYTDTGGTEAGGLRVFELEVPELKPTMADYDARQLLIPVQQNYGVAGAVYAAYVARNRATIKQMVDAMNATLHQRYDFSSKERFWSMTMTTLLVGATLANACGLTRLNVAAIEQYLDVEFGRQRKELKTQSHATLSDDRSVLGLLADLKSELRGRAMVVTEIIPSQTGGHPVPAVVVDTDVSQLKEVWVQLGTQDGRIRMRVRRFNEWLHKRKLQPKHVLHKLEKYYLIQQRKLSIGVGVPFLDAASDRSECYDLTPKPSAPGSSLDD